MIFYFYRSFKSTMSALDLIKLKQKAFLSSPKFAVVGASKDQKKFGTKVDFIS
jgi:hypothetical protein